MCGEQMANRNSLPEGLGSPPRVRGTGTAQKSSIADMGITPACAGNRAL